MDCAKTKIFFSFLFILFFHFVKGGNISGKVTDETNEGLPFVSIYVRGATVGVISNKEGNYSIELPAGNYDLVFQFIGYEIQIEHVQIESDEQKIILNVKMEPQPYEIPEVTVNANAEDPAYEVMRKAIRMRKYYFTQVKSYSCNVYIKGLQRVTSYPKKFMGIDINAEGNIDRTTGIFYLSESVSKLSFMHPDKIHEEMISSKVSGNSRAFSYNQASEMLINFYDNLMKIDPLSKRGLVSPIAEGAMFFYNYHLAATFFENGRLINKIEVLPKRKFDPLFRGYIFICENTWRIHSTDLYIVKDAGVEFVDTLRINQVHLPTSPPHSPSPTGEGAGGEAEEVWLPFSQKFTFVFSVLGFKGNGVYIGIFSKYNIKTNSSSKNPLAEEIPKNSSSRPEQNKTMGPSVPAKQQKKEKKDTEIQEKKLFTGEVLKVNDDANKKDSVYWAETRPVPLTEEEKIDYKKKDSIQVIHESKPFQDSVDKKTNKFKPANLIFGYSHDNRFKKRTTSFSPLIQNVEFNTVQGLIVFEQIGVTKEYEKKKNLDTKLSASYGFSDQRWNGEGETRYAYNPKKFSSVGIRGGLQTVQFFSRNASSFNPNQKNPISPLINTLYTLLDERNYAKLYQKIFVEMTHSFEPVNGLLFRSGMEYSDRAPLMNRTDFTLFPSVKNHRTYTSNDPLYPENDTSFSFSQNQLLELSANLLIRFGQKYITRPDEKWSAGSTWPSLFIKYRKGVPALGSDMNYDFMKIGISDKINLKLLGSSRYLISWGKFLNTRRIEFMDYNHFFGNRTLYSNFSFSDFQLMDYYTNSTKDYFVEAHYEHDFGGFILNKFPLLRKLKVNELAGIHYLHTEKRESYFELFFGMEKLNIARVDFVMGFSEGKQTESGIRLGLKIGS